MHSSSVVTARPLVATGHGGAGGRLALHGALAAETGQNPFFTLEILRHLAETGMLARDGDSPTATSDSFEPGLPVSVRQVIGQRVACLGGTTHRVLLPTVTASTSSMR